MRSEPPLPIEELLADTEWLRALAFRLVGDRGTAEDLAQEAVLAALRRPDVDRHRLPAWLAGVVRHLSFRWIRSQRTRRRHESAVARGTTEASHVDVIARTELERRLIESVLELPEPGRSILLLRYRDGVAPAEIARRRGMPDGTVRSHLSRGLEELRERLDARHGGRRDAWRSTFAAAFALERRALTAASGAAIAAAAALVVGAGVYAWATPSGGSSRGSASFAEATRVSPVASAAPAPATRAPATQGVFPAPRPDSTASPPGVAAPLVGKVVDLETGEPLPRFALAVAQGPRSFLLETDANGEFRTPEGIPDGPVVLELTDRPGGETLRRLVHEHRSVDGVAPPETFALPVGATFELAMELPAGLAIDDLFVLLQGHRVWRTIHGDDDWLSIEHERLRAGPPLPWVRFAYLQTKDLSFAAPWTLTVGSRDGLWRGVAAVDRARGRAPEPVALELLPAGAIRGVVREEGGRAPERVRVHLAWPEGARRNGLATGTVSDDATREGAYAFASLEPGRYVLRTESLWHLPAEHVVEVEAGKVATADLVVARRPSAGDVHGTLRSRTGRDVTSTVDLAIPKGLATRVLHVTPVDWSGPPGARVGRFRFEALPSETYLIRPTPRDEAGDRHTAWSPEKATVKPGGPELAFEYLDDVPAADLAVRAIDAVTGREIPWVDLMAYFDPPRGTRYKHVESGSVVWRGVPLDREFKFSARPRGYLPIALDQSAFGPVRDGVRVAEVRFQPGWGARVAVIGPKDDTPIPGATILLDGVESGTTNEKGMLEVVRPTRPATIRAAHPAYEPIDSSEVDARTGRFSDDRWTWLFLRMKPRAAEGGR